MRHGIKISNAQLEALLQANRGRLQYSVCGWTADGSHGFQTATVAKLRKLGLLSFLPPEHTSKRGAPKGRGSFFITSAGIEALNEEIRQIEARHPAALQGEAA